MSARTPNIADVERDMAHAGNASSAKGYSYELVDAGAGPRPLPEWLADANIRWNFGWSNRPELELCFRSNPLAGIRYRKDIANGRGWFGANPAGDCFETHWHGGVPRPTEFERNIGWDTADGKYTPGAKMRKEPYTMLATHEEKGYGGRHFDIIMADDSQLWPGETIRLRGPWHGGTGRADTVAVVGVVWDDAAKARFRKPTHWTKATKSFGYNILERTFIDALATFYPHCPIARVTSGPDREGKRRSWIEPCLPQTQAPRFMTLDQLIVPMERAA